MQFILFTLVFLISCFFSMIGMGGGMFYVPLLLFFGESIYSAGAISLSLIFAASTSALLVFHREKLIDWKLAIIIDPPTDIMAFIGGYFSGVFPAIYLKIILVVVLFLSAFSLWGFSGKSLICRYSDEAKKSWWYWKRNFNGRSYTVNLLWVLPITALVGLLAGMLGITGGVIKLPLMVVLCGIPMDIAIATSTVMISITALFGLAGHFLAGHVESSLVFPLMILTFLGGQIGSRISIRSDKKLLRKILAISLCAMALKMIIDII